jgi:hypothetical protein
MQASGAAERSESGIAVLAKPAVLNAEKCA